MERRKEKPKRITFSTGIRLKGNFIKNGLDTSRFVNLIVCFDSPDHFKQKGYEFPPNLFYISEVQYGEAMGVLIHKHKLTKKETKEKIKSWIEKFPLVELRSNESTGGYESIVRSANNKVIKKFGENYEIGELDVSTIAIFMQNGINIIHVKDKGFEETCRELEIEVMLTPERDLKEERSKKN